MLAVVCFLWGDRESKWQARYRYTEDHVRVLRNMVARNLSVEHRFVCVSDRPIDGVDTVPIEQRLAIPGTRYPKLMVYRDDAGDVFGADYILLLDLDVVILRDITPLVDRPEDVLAWHNPRYARQPTYRAGRVRRSAFNSTIVRLRAGSLPGPYREFDPETTPTRIREAGYLVTDQGVLSEHLDSTGPGYRAADGVLSYRIEVVRRGLPDGARLVSFHGPVMPDMPAIRSKHRWVREHYR